MSIAIDLHTQPQLDTRSDLLKAQSRAVRGKVNACPFGCDFKDLDDHGYCRHLIGFSNDGKRFEPMIRDPGTGRRIVRCRQRPTDEVAEWDDEGVPRMMKVMEPMLDNVRKNDVLVRISISYRVYRDVGGTKPTPKFEPQKGSEDEVVKSQFEAMTRHSLQLPNEPIPESFFVADEETK